METSAWLVLTVSSWWEADPLSTDLPVETSAWLVLRVSSLIFLLQLIFFKNPVSKIKTDFKGR
jgi:hypothetical protein